MQVTVYGAASATGKKNPFFRDMLEKKLYYELTNFPQCYQAKEDF